MLKEDTAPRSLWPQDKIGAFRAAAEQGNRHRLIFEPLLGTGRRIGDVLRMRWSDISERHRCPAGENLSGALNTTDRGSAHHVEGQSEGGNDSLRSAQRQAGQL